VGREVLSKGHRKEIKKYTKETRHGQETLILIGWTRNSGKVTSRAAMVQCSMLPSTHKIKGLRYVAWGDA